MAFLTPPFVPCTTKFGTLEPYTSNPQGGSCGPTEWYIAGGQTWAQFPSGQHRCYIQIDAVAPADESFNRYSNPVGDQNCNLWIGGTQFALNYSAPSAGTEIVLAFNCGAGTGDPTWLWHAPVRVDYINLPTEAACGPPPPPCQYGTRATSAAPTIAAVSDALVTAACAAVGAPWAAIIFAPLVGYALDSGILCGAGPPAVPTIDAHTPLDTIENKLAMFNSMAWFALCECTPGATTPIPYTPPTLVQPPHWPVYGPYPCSNSDICTTLQLILKRLDQLSSSQNISIDSRTTVYALPDPLAYTVGTVHTGLTGSGSLTIGDLVGLRVEITSASPGRSLEGNPPYLWDVGWASVSDGGAMLQEKRLTRTSFEWFPLEMKLATTFGYFLKGDEQLRVTELVPRTP